MYKFYFNIIILFFFLLTGTLATAQKCGHLNFGNLIAMMPETGMADAELEAYQKTLVQKGEEMAAAFQKEYAAFAKAIQNGDLNPVQQQNKQAGLQNEQQEILAYEQEIVQLVGTKRQELLAPIIEKAQQAVSEVAQRNGFDAVLDTSVFGAVLFGLDSKDLMPQVKLALGIE